MKIIRGGGPCEPEVFSDLGVGSLFIDRDGDLAMKIDSGKAGNAIFWYRGETVLFAEYEPDHVVKHLPDAVLTTNE
jgi:hypothetical protein